MSAYEGVSNAEMADALRLDVDYPPAIEAVLPAGYSLIRDDFAAAAADRLAAYERIVAALRDWGEPRAAHYYDCGICGAHETQDHDPTCAWLLAQQTKAGEP